MHMRNFIIAAATAGVVLFAASPIVINGTLSDSTTPMAPVAHIVTSYTTSGSAGIGR